MKNMILASLLILSASLIQAHLAAEPSSSGPGKASSARYQTIVVGLQSESERLATVDLQRYLAQVTKTVPKIIKASQWNTNPIPAIIIGTSDNNPLLESLNIADRKLGAQGFYLADTKLDGIPVIIAAGDVPEGATNAIYGLLRELGFRFYLGSESIPDTLPSALSAKAINKRPAFDIRGVLPWYNFFNSPTAWDPIDHRAFVDQLIRMGANYVGFHTYDAEPFAAYEENGKMMWGERLLNTSAPTWGTSPLPTSDFGFGTGMLYPDRYFGAESTMQISDRNEAIKAEQDIMRDALEYARKRGLHPCIGFEMWGDPFNPKDRDVFLKRLNHLLDQYPAIEYLWLWQAETQGAQGYPENYNMHVLPYSLDKRSPLPLYGAARRDTFRRIVYEAKGQAPFFQDTGAGEDARANEGARLEQFAQLALHAFKRRVSSPKLAISGWGGETRILSAEYYDGLDKLLPKDVVFTSLDFIAPLPKVDSIYTQLPKDRQRWPIPWLENDGDQWQPQPYVHILESTVRDAHKGGAQGMLGIHWRTREIEENFGYIVNYSWDTKLTAEGYFKDIARNCYDAQIADEMAVIHSELDNMGYRWVGGGGQAECAPFTWGPGTEEKAKQLQTIRDKASSLLPRAGKGTEKLKWLITNMNWVLEFRKAELAAVEARDLLGQASRSDSAKSAELAKKAISILKDSNLGRAMHAYAKRLTTRGEYGVLATINTKAYADWKVLWDDAIKKSGANPSEYASEKWNPDPDILLPRLITSTEQDKELELLPVVLGGGDGWIHCRAIGTSGWTTKPLNTLNGWVKKTVIEAGIIRQPGIEFGFSFNADPAVPMAYGPITVTVTPEISKSTRPAMKPLAAKTYKIKLIETNNPAIPVEITWNDIPGIDYYRVYRDNSLAAETAVAMFPDVPNKAICEYRVDAVRDGTIVAGSNTLTVITKMKPVNEKFVIEVRTNAAGVLLKWPKAKSLSTTTYRILRSPASDETKSEVISVKKAGRSSGHSYRDLPSDGKWKYTIIPTNITGQEGKPVSTIVDFKANKDIKPVISLPLNARPADANIVGEVSFTDAGADVSGGYIELPHNDQMNMGNAMTLSFEFNANDIKGMPVLICHGSWQVDGWFVQILNGSLVIRTANGDAMGTWITPGVWYKVSMSYDGSTFTCKVNDQWVDQGASEVVDVPSIRKLIIGQYEARSPDFAFRGTIRNIRIY
ncbi:MAG: hypothetical protein ACYC0V_20505, partial [Armatimonadota bacterium]